MVPQPSGGPSTRVAITGLGALCAKGAGVDTLWDFACSLSDEPVDRTPPPTDAPDWVDDRLKVVLDAQAVYGLQVAEQAWEQAALGEYDPARVGIIGASVYGALKEVIEQEQLLRDVGVPAVSGHLALNATKIAGTTLIAHRLGIQGHTKVTTGACATGTYALGDGLDLVRSGRVDAVIVAASQAPPLEVVLAAYRNLRAMTPSGWVRPFDRRRDGFMPTAGAAAMVLESEAHAKARGAHILGELRGAGNTIDATMLPSASGPAPRACIDGALADACYAPGAIRLISAHGTGTRKNDEFEAMILREVFGDAVPPVTAPKRVLGHAFGATGVQAAVLAVEGMRHQLVPPVGIEVEPDPALDVPIVVGGPQSWEPGPVLTLAYGLGGHNGAVVLAPWSDDPSAFGAPPSGTPTR